MAFVGGKTSVMYFIPSSPWVLLSVSPQPRSWCQNSLVQYRNTTAITPMSSMPWPNLY